ncbi:MAG: hypothetical protein ABW217_16885 [Polyangiaceae bacterium]
MFTRRAALALGSCLYGLGLVGCGGRELVLVDGSDWQAHVFDTGKPSHEELGSLMFRSSVCQGEDLTPQYRPLDENDLVTFLRARKLSVRVERPRTDLAYLLIEDAGTRAPARLRVAILRDADEAGRELADAMQQHGQGSWGVHRSNLAVLGPVGDAIHDLAFAAEIDLVCWGVFTIRGKDDTVVIPGAYREL